MSPVKWLLSVPLCQCAGVIRDRMSWLSIIHSVRNSLVASGHNLAMSSSAEEISHHFITSFHHEDSLLDILLLGVHPRNLTYTEGHRLNTAGSKSKTHSRDYGHFLIQWKLFHYQRYQKTTIYIIFLSYINLYSAFFGLLFKRNRCDKTKTVQIKSVIFYTLLVWIGKLTRCASMSQHRRNWRCGAGLTGK